MSLESNPNNTVKHCSCCPEFRKTFKEEETVREGPLAQEDLLPHTLPWARPGEASPSVDACAFLVEAFLSRSASHWGPQRGRGPGLTCLICFPVQQVPMVPHPWGESLQMGGKSCPLQDCSCSSEPHGPSAPARRASRLAPPSPVLYSLCLRSRIAPPAQEDPHPFLLGWSKSYSSLQGLAPVPNPLKILQQSLPH